MNLFRIIYNQRSRVYL